MSIPVIVRCGLSGGEHPIGSINLHPSDVEAACDLYASTFILNMGRHYHRYVVGGGRWLQSNILYDIYAKMNPAPVMTNKQRASSVTGNIGEGLLGLVARRKLGATRMLDVLPLNVTPAAKCPDFRVRINPMFPQSFRSATTLNPPIGFQYWPAESKAIESNGKATQVLERALTQLGTYWYEREHLEPSVAGFGLVCLFIYKGTKAHPLQVVRLHVFVPRNQASVLQRIRHFQSIDSREGFLDELQIYGSPSRSALKDV